MAGFEWRNKTFHADDVNVRKVYDVLNDDCEHPSFYLYSKSTILSNIHGYTDALKDLTVTSFLGFSMKANCNLSILEIFRESGCTAIAVSGHEVLLALKCGFSSNR